MRSLTVPRYVSESLKTHPKHASRITFSPAVKTIYDKLDNSYRLMTWRCLCSSKAEKGSGRALQESGFSWRYICLKRSFLLLKGTFSFEWRAEVDEMLPS